MCGVSVGMRWLCVCFVLEVSHCHAVSRACTCVSLGTRICVERQRAFVVDDVGFNPLLPSFFTARATHNQTVDGYRICSVVDESKAKEKMDAV